MWGLRLSISLSHLLRRAALHQLRDRQAEDERPKGPLTPRINVSEPACVLAMKHFTRGKQYFRARSLFEVS